MKERTCLFLNFESGLNKKFLFASQIKHIKKKNKEK